MGRVVEEAVMDGMKQTNIAFNGDMCPLSLAARTLAVRLKRGNAVVAANDRETFCCLLENEDEVERSLNADFLTLHLDKKNGCAWAEVVDLGAVEDAIKPLNKRAGVSPQDGALFCVLAYQLSRRRAEGHAGDEAGWLVSTADTKDAWLETLGQKLTARSESQTRQWNKATGMAVSRGWFEWVDDDKKDVMRISPLVLAMYERGFCAGVYRDAEIAIARDKDEKEI